jgi:hypothetical protein
VSPNLIDNIAKAAERNKAKEAKSLLLDISLLRYDIWGNQRKIADQARIMGNRIQRLNAKIAELQEVLEEIETDAGVLTATESALEASGELVKAQEGLINLLQEAPQ